eukprot:5383825-Amphidinium_carterae.2
MRRQRGRIATVIKAGRFTFSHIWVSCTASQVRVNKNHIQEATAWFLFHLASALICKWLYGRRVSCCNLCMQIVQPIQELWNMHVVLDVTCVNQFGQNGVL